MGFGATELLTNELRWDTGELANGKVRLCFLKTDLLSHFWPYLPDNLTSHMMGGCQFKRDLDHLIINTEVVHCYLNISFI